MTDIVLTADRTLMTNYNNFSPLGYLGCLPDRLLPNFAVKLIFPKLKHGEATYGLRRVESKLLIEGFDVKIISPQEINKIYKIKPKVVGISTVDPLSTKPGSWTLGALMGGGESVYEREFRILLHKINKIKEKQQFKIIIGGNGALDLSSSNKYSKLYDCIAIGSTEKISEIFKKAVDNNKIPKKFYSGYNKLNNIPIIKGPSRNGYVQITEGCPRHCDFCSPGMLNLISYPKKRILREIELNLKNNIKIISLITEDIFLYGAKDVYINDTAVVDLIKSISKIGKKYNVNTINMSNISVASTVQGKNICKKITDILGCSKRKSIDIIMGIETGSNRLVKKYMNGKTKPYNSKKWTELVKEAINIQNDNYWYPWCSLIAGLPDEKEEDVIKTLDLIDDLKSNKVYYFIFYFVPYKNLALEKNKFFTHENISQRRWELFNKCWMKTIKFIKKDLIPGLQLDIQCTTKEKINRKVTDYLIIKILNNIERELKKYKNNPQGFKEEYSLMNLKGLNLIKYLFSRKFHHSLE